MRHYGEMLAVGWGFSMNAGHVGILVKELGRKLWEFRQWMPRDEGIKLDSK